jgi:hypothetical protein
MVSMYNVWRKLVCGLVEYARTCRERWTRLIRPSISLCLTFALSRILSVRFGRFESYKSVVSSTTLCLEHDRSTHTTHGIVPRYTALHCPVL